MGSTTEPLGAVLLATRDNPRSSDMASNSDLVRSGYEAFGRQDIPAVLNLSDTNIDWTVPASVRLGGHFTGHDEVVGFFGTFMEAYTEFQVQPQEFVEAGDRVIVLGHHVGKAAGGDFDIPFAHAWRMKNGKAV